MRNINGALKTCSTKKNNKLYFIALYKKCQWEISRDLIKVCLWVKMSFVAKEKCQISGDI